ncbi:MAG: DEAD/DEAH box helicase [Lactobacillus sp.]|jgi:superfamily II DNA/RNA helicase|nr:DEAD/DEAH box helicase [Lactobacillus sp.]MCI1466879.1 DEAD/DEAH box helicase [Lactobacillus sp.]MCI1481697.1 DEAD/DEAH box helicase [Lactobacillus sp.]
MYEETILKQLHEQGLHQPALIQAKTYQPIKDGENLLALAKTGTGKTLAYALPVLERIKKIGGQAVIFEPTAELAVQVSDVIMPFAKALGLKTLGLIGSGNRQRQLQKLRERRPAILVATPGRFFDILSTGKLQAANLRSLVIDEPDDVLEFQNLDLFQSLSRQLPVLCQVLLFGATMSTSVARCETVFSRKFLQIDVRAEQELKLHHEFLQVDNAHKLDFLQRLTRSKHFKGIVFFNNNRRLEHFAGILGHTKLRFAVLGTKMSSQARQQARRRFIKSEVKLLLATDLAARGLDLPGVTDVVNFDLPANQADYLHRAGRTGRMGKPGFVITLGDDHDARSLRQLVGDEIKIERVYFGKSGLTTKAPQAKVEPAPKPNHKKHRQRRQRNKGYHPQKWRKEK